MTSMPPRQGYTKTGKSLKAVRRYYAILNAGKSPKRNDDPAPKERAPSPMDPVATKSKNKVKSPKDDQLTNRIADELKSQKNANTMRGVEISNLPTERSELPVAKQLGLPAFQTTPTVTKPKSAKSIKSTASIRSVAWNRCTDNDLGQYQISVIVACLMIGLVYITAWIFSASFNRIPSYLSDEEVRENSLIWPGITSIAIVIASLLHLFLRTHCVAVGFSLMASIGSTLSLVVYIIIQVVHYDKITQRRLWFTTDNPLKFWLAAFYLVYVFIMASIILKHAFTNACTKSEARAIDMPPPQLSDMAA